MTAALPDLDPQGGPLLGCRVVVISASLRHFLCAVLLAEQGADIRQLLPRNLMQGWRAVFGTEAASRGFHIEEWTGRQARAAIIAQADFVIADRRPTRPESLALTAKQVWCSMPARPSHDGAPIESSTLLSGVSEGPQPSTWSFAISELFSALNGALAVASQLPRINLPRRNSVVEVSRLLAELQACGSEALTLDGIVPTSARSAELPGRGLHRTRDGNWIYLMPATRNVRARAAAYLAASDVTVSDARDADVMSALIRNVSASGALTSERVLNEYGVPASVVRTAAESFGQLTGSLRLEDRRSVSVVARAGTRGRAGGCESCKRGPRTLSSPCAAPATRGPKRDRSPPLRVLDFSQVLAGPMCGRLLMQLGASVLKIDDPSRPPSGFRYHWFINGGKRSALVDLRSPAGQQLIRRAVPATDVVIENFSKGVGEDLGLGESRLRVLNPSVTFVRVSAYAAQGPYSNWRGFDPNAQAVAGVMSDYGAPGPPRELRVVVNDFCAGLLGAFGALLASQFICKPCGVGARVDTTLLQAARLFNLARSLSQQTLEAFLNEGSAAAGTPLQGRPDPKDGERNRYVDRKSGSVLTVPASPILVGGGFLESPEELRDVGIDTTSVLAEHGIYAPGSARSAVKDEYFFESV